MAANTLVFQQMVLANDGSTHADYLAANLSKLQKLRVDPSLLEPGVADAYKKAAAAKFQVSDAVGNEVAAFHNAVVADGRFISQALKDPTGTAAKLNIQLSPAATAAINTAVGFVGPTPDNPVVFVICVAVIVVIAKLSVGKQVVVDESGTIKL